MAKTVGFSRCIKLSWIKKAIQLNQENVGVDDVKKELNEYLTFEIDSPTNLRKTREILMNMWCYDLDNVSIARNQAKKIIEKYPDDIVPVSLCLMYITYPVVADICKYMGRIFASQDELTNKIVKEKLYDEWGERGTLEPICGRVTQTLKDFGILSEAKKNRYKLNKIEIYNWETISFLLKTAMLNDGNSYYTYNDLHRFEVLFPYSFNITKEELLKDNNFEITQFAGEIAISIKNSSVNS